MKRALGKIEIDREKEEKYQCPGFIFHPTDEELVGFYLLNKIKNTTIKPLDPITNLDIYKFDPWDLPRMAVDILPSQREWYFFGPRERKYRNSTRPNRLTCSGFWKATGIDRTIKYQPCNNNNNNNNNNVTILGLKKSLVFYHGKASKSKKTNWTMHEFRFLETQSECPSLPTSMDANGDSTKWALCKIFQRKSTSSPRQDNIELAFKNRKKTSNESKAMHNNNNNLEPSEDSIAYSSIISTNSNSPTPPPLITTYDQMPIANNYENKTLDHLEPVLTSLEDNDFELEYLLNGNEVEEPRRIHPSSISRLLDFPSLDHYLDM